MAEKNRPAPKAQVQARTASKLPPAKPQKKNRTLTALLIFFLIMGILGAGFAAGVFLNVIDMQKLGQTYKLYDYPIVGKYFTKPLTNFEIIPIEEQPSKEQATTNTPVANPVTPSSVTETKIVDKVDLEREIKAKQLEEQKRISKLARLYGAMKPDEAVTIMNQLDDEMVLAIFSRMEEEQVAKILALLDAKRAARLTQEMIKAKPASIGKV